MLRIPSAELNGESLDPTYVKVLRSPDVTAAAAGGDEANAPPPDPRAPCGSGSGIPAAGDPVAPLSEAPAAFAAALLAFRSSAFRFFSSACARPC
jgi:hypothetical protein